MLFSDIRCQYLIHFDTADMFFSTKSVRTQRKDPTFYIKVCIICHFLDFWSDYPSFFAYDRGRLGAPITVRKCCEFILISTYLHLFAFSDGTAANSLARSFLKLNLLIPLINF